MKARYERALQIKVNGYALGDIPLGDHKEEIKRVNELLGAAWALVGANVESKISELYTIPPGNDLPTPDLDAVLVDGRPN